MPPWEPGECMEWSQRTPDATTFDDQVQDLRELLAALTQTDRDGISDELMSNEPMMAPAIIKGVAGTPIYADRRLGGFAGIPGQATDGKKHTNNVITG